MDADHDAMCGAPPSTHKIHTLEEAVFHCRDHVMTAINSDESGYAVVYLTPSAMADWRAGPASIEFDVSTARSTKRDWIDVWLTPWEDGMVLPLDGSTPDLNGPPRKALRFNLGDNFAWSIHSYPGDVKISKLHWRDLPVPFSSKQRDKFTITIGNGAIKMEYRNVEKGVTMLVDRVPLPKSLGFDRAIVQFGHHSYTPSKDCLLAGHGRCGPNTWHWDNVKISPSIPLTFNKIGRLDAAGSITVMPGWLRFAARGATELNWGSGWVKATPVNGPHGNIGQFASYFVRVPEGVTMVQIRGKESWAGAWRAKEISVWDVGAPDVEKSAAVPSAAPGKHHH